MYFYGVGAVRFEYQNSLAYVSLAFPNYSDSIFIRITNSNNDYLKTTFNEIAKYYDNREAVVTATADDLDKYNYDEFLPAFNIFRENNLWLTCGVITKWSTGDGWDHIQSQLDQGYVEVVSHSYSHVHEPYPDIVREVEGSKNEIIDNLDLPPLFKCGNKEYVYAYLYPYGDYSHDIDVVASNSKYIVCRTIEKYQYDYSDWNEYLEMFNRVGEVLEIGTYIWTNVNILNSSFDETVNMNSIYHMILHPKNLDFSQDYIIQHLNYISNRNNIWYTAFGHLYLYNLLRISINEPNVVNLELKILLEGSYFSNNNEMTTSINSMLPLTQPFNCPPCNYSGTEQINNMPNENIVDWVLVSLFSEIDDAEPETRRSGFLRNDGNVVDLDGSSPLRFNVANTQYFIKVEHRNHLPIMSAEPISFSSP